MNRVMSSCLKQGLMQDWSTASGSNGVLAVTQPAAGWIDLAAARDAVFYLEVSDALGDPAGALHYETSPTRDPSQFRSMASRALSASSPSPTPYVQRVTVYDNPPVPLARWVRWRIAFPAGAWAVSFRINVMAYGR